jgi:hypothetical protein
MKKLAFLAVTAFAASTVVAAASVTVVSLDGYCNAYTIRKNGSLMAARDTPTCGRGFGTGVLGTTTDQVRNAIIALQDPATRHTQFEYTFSYPFVTGGTWSLYNTGDGKHTYLLFSGTYSVSAPGAKNAKVGKSATAR